MTGFWRVGQCLNRIRSLYDADYWPTSALEDHFALISKIFHLTSCFTWFISTFSLWIIFMQDYHTCEELTHWKRLWCWEGLGAGGEGDDRGWDGWMASLTLWTWVWVIYGSWWWTGRPGVLQFMGSQRVGHDWATELNWTELNHTFRASLVAQLVKNPPARQKIWVRSLGWEDPLEKGRGIRSSILVWRIP